jgi:methionyl-tRNA synthetase
VSTEFLRKNNDELVAGWGNLVNRSISMAAKNVGSIPKPGTFTEADVAMLDASRTAFGSVGALLERSRQKAAIGEAMRVVAEANKYLSDQAPWKLKDPADADRRDTILHVALQVVDDAKTLLTPFLPHTGQRVHELLGGTGTWSGSPEIREVTEGERSYPVITGEYEGVQAKWEPVPLEVGRPLAPPTPVFRKLEPSIVDEELARLEGA